LFLFYLLLFNYRKSFGETKLLRQIAAYPHYSILIDNISKEDAGTANLSDDKLIVLAERFDLYLKDHPNAIINFSQLEKLSELGKMVSFAKNSF
jgi:hypothetical protein